MDNMNLSSDLSSANSGQNSSIDPAVDTAQPAAAEATGKVETGADQVSTIGKSDTPGPVTKGYEKPAAQPAIPVPTQTNPQAGNAGMAALGDWTKGFNVSQYVTTFSGPMPGTMADEEANEPPPLTDEEEAAYSDANGTATPAQIKKLVQTGLTPDMFAKLKKELSPDSGDTPSPSLQDLLTQVLGEVMANAKLNPPMTKDELQANIAKFVKNPEDPTIPPNLLNMLTHVLGIVNKQIESQYDSLNTASAAPAAAAQKSQSLSIAQNGLDQAQEMVDAKLAQVAAEPDSPEKLDQYNYLKLIGAAIASLQNSITQMETVESTISSKESDGKLDAQLGSIAQQAAEAAKQEADTQKEGKYAKFGPLAKVMDVVTKILICAVAACMGPEALAMAIVYCAKPDAFDPMFKGVSDAMHALGAATGNAGFTGVCDQAAFAINVTLACIVSCGNPVMLLGLMTKPNGPMDNWLASMDVKKENRAIAEAVVNAVVQIAATIALTVATAGATVEMIPAEVAGAVGAAFVDTAATSAEAIKAGNTVIAIIQAIVGLTMAGMSITSTVVSIKMDLLQADIVMSKARASSIKEKFDAIIQAITKIIQTLLDALNGNPDWLVSLGNMQSKKYSDASQVMSGIANAMHT